MTIHVDQETCTRCGICSEVCPMSIIGQPGESDLPRVQEGRDSLCISCGQCEAFCPTGACIQEPGTGGDRAGPGIGAPGDMSSESLGAYVRSRRRSVRQYLPDPVPRGIIESLLDIARYAPSGGNRQPVQWLVVHDPEKVHRVAALTIEWMEILVESRHPMSSYAPHLISAWENGTDVICRGAPHLLIPHVPEDAGTAPVDAIIALTHVDIAAPSFGIGTCWAGFVAMASNSYNPLQEFYSLPKGRVPAYAMMCGYPRYLPRNVPHRNPLQVMWK